MFPGMRIDRLVVSLSILVACACGGSKQGPDSPAGDGDGDSEAPALTEDDKIRKAQLATCGPMCERISECALAEARERMSEEEFARLQPDKAVEQNTAECSEKCGSATLSPRQIKVIRECVNGPQLCQEYHQCLDQAKPQG